MRNCVISLFSIYLIFNLFTNVSCIRCWACRSDYDPNCGEPFFNSTIPLYNCNDERDSDDHPGLVPTSCVKMVHIVNERPVLFRECAWRLPDDYSYTCPSTRDGPNELVTFCEFCYDRDGCNSGTSIKLSLLATLTSIFGIVYKLYYITL